MGSVEHNGATKVLRGVWVLKTLRITMTLLAKLGWRIHSKPDSLLAQVLKGKYFPECTFLESKETSGSSHGDVRSFQGS